MFFFNDTATTEIYTLSLHDALPISNVVYGTINTGILLTSSLTMAAAVEGARAGLRRLTLICLGVTIAFGLAFLMVKGDRKSTRLNSSHANISYAVFCLDNNSQHQYS